MKYLSKKHIIILMVCLIVLCVMLLMGERFAHDQLVTGDGTQVAPPSEMMRSPEESFSKTETFSGKTKLTGTFVQSRETKLPYQDALSLYQGSIIQFGENCQLVNKDRSFNLGKEIMVDNRSSASRLIRIGVNVVPLAPFDYGFITLRDKGSYIVSCDSQPHIADLMVQ